MREKLRIFGTAGALLLVVLLLLFDYSPADTITGGRAIAPAIFNYTASHDLSTHVAEFQGCFITNSGAGADITINLPAATAGSLVTFYNLALFDFILVPNSGDVFQGYACVADDKLQSDGVRGTYLSLLCVGAGSWEIVGVNGTWTNIGH